MSQIAEVIDIEELRRRRAQREAPRPATSMPAYAQAAWYAPVWYTWVPVWRPAAPANPLLQAAGWGGQ
jgi:hypothetical protein